MTITKNLQATTQKSYYGKAKIIYTYYEDVLYSITLKSYNTVILIYTPHDNSLYKDWNGYSRTTMLHINDFINYINSNYKNAHIEHFNKKSWLDYQKDFFNNEYFLVVGSNGIVEHKTNIIFDTYEDAQDFADSLNIKNKYWSYWVEY